MIELNVTFLLGALLCAIAIGFFLLRGKRRDLVSIVATVLVVTTILIIAAHPTAFSGMGATLLPKVEEVNAAPSPVLVPTSPAVEEKALGQHKQEQSQVKATHPTETSHFWSDLLDGVIRFMIVIGFVIALITAIIVLCIIRSRIVTRPVVETPCCSVCGQADQVHLYEHRNGRNGRVKSHLCLDCAGSLHASLV